MKKKQTASYSTSIKNMATATEQPRVKRTPIKELNGFSFYIEDPTNYGISLNPHSVPAREYYIEHIESKGRVALPVALKFGEIGEIQIDTEMFDFIHDYDEQLD